MCFICGMCLQLESAMEEKWRSVLPLDQASDNVKNEAEALQTSVRCSHTRVYFHDMADHITSL